MENTQNIAEKKEIIKNRCYICQMTYGAKFNLKAHYTSKKTSISCRHVG